MSWWRARLRQQTAAGVGRPTIRTSRSSASRASPRSSRATPTTTRGRSPDVTVDIGRGEYVSVSGPSGCGKSTFLSILALLDSPTLRAVLAERPRRPDRAHAVRARALRNVDIGLIFQSFNLIGDMTVYENVEYPLTLRGAIGGRPAPARRGRARTRGTDRPRETAPGRALWRPPAARRHRAGHRRPAADSARRRADRQSRLEERRRR